MSPQLVTLLGADDGISRRDYAIASALYALSNTTPAQRAALSAEYPELMGIWPWVAKAAAVVAKVGKKGVKLVAKAVKKARKTRVAKAVRKATRDTAQSAPAAVTESADVSAPVTRAPSKQTMILLGAGALVALMLLRRR